MPLTKESALAKDRRTAKEAALRVFADKRRATTVMQHRHFAVIAHLIATLDTPERFTVAVHFANGLAKHTPNFDRARFLRACEGAKPSRDWTKGDTK